MGISWWGGYWSERGYIVPIYGHSLFRNTNIQRHAISSKTFGKAEGIKDIFRRARCACQLIYDVLPNDSRLRRFFLLRKLENLSSRTWIQPLVIFTIAKYHCSFVIESSRRLRLTKIIPFIPSRSRNDFKCQQLSNCDVINLRAASYCDVTLICYSDTVSMDAFIITMALPAKVFQHGGSSSWSLRDLSLCITFFSW